MSSDSDSDDLANKFYNSSEESQERKKEETVENNISVTKSILMTNNPFPKNNFPENKIPPSQKNLVKNNENEQLDKLEINLELGKKIGESTENKNDIFKKKDEKNEDKKVEVKNENKEEKKEIKKEIKNEEKEEDIEAQLPDLNKDSNNIGMNSNYGRRNNDMGINGRFNNKNYDRNNNIFRENYRNNYRRNNIHFPSNFSDTNFNDNNFNRTQIYDINNDAFYNNNKETVMDIKEVYPDLENIEILKILNLIYRNDSRTIFEVMNLIRREYIIINTLKEIKDKNERQYQGEKRDINEMNNEEDILFFHDSILKQYKTNNNSSSNEWNYINDNDKRRELMKDINGFYNYLPIINLEINGSNKEIYAKNENEILYHSLMYKTILCRNKRCSNNLCPFAHGLGEDLRLIYDYQDEKICKLMLKLMKKKTFHIEDYLNHFEIPLKFSLTDFKILKCKLGNQCQKDTHLCYCYHNIEEIRRPPKLFRYINKRCPYAQKTKENPYRPDLCIYGIFCHYIHSKGEFNYHEKNFRKIFPCTRKKGIDGNCIFYETCYGKHEKKNKNYDNDSSNSNILGDSNLNDSKSEKNKEIIEYNQKIKNIENVLKTFFCKRCGIIPNDFSLYVTKCGHTFCHGCAVKCTKEKKCFKCEDTIEKGSILIMDFGLNKK